MVEFKVCMDGPKCSEKYRLDFVARTKDRGVENQGTGNLCEDLADVAKIMGIEATAIPSQCLDHCPIPGERSSVITPNGKIYRAYFDNLPALLKQFV